VEDSLRPGKQVGERSDSRRCSSADSEKMREKIAKIYSRQGTASNMFRDTSANSSFSPVEFSKIGKLTSLDGLKFLLKNTFLCVFARKPTILETLGSIFSSN
jgi:hypothetical protein